MTRWAGVLRSAESLAAARATIDEVRAHAVDLPPTPLTYELRNLVDVATAMLAGASTREESRGCHTRDDYPETLAAFHIRLVQ